MKLVTLNKLLIRTPNSSLYRDCLTVPILYLTFLEKMWGSDE